MGLTVQKFFQDNLEAVYKLRLGVDCLEVYNLERSAEEIQRRLAEKDSELGRAEGEVDMRELQQEVMDKEEEEVSRSQVMKRKRDQPLESEETRNEREHGLKQHLSLGVLEDMHKDAGTIFKSPMVKMVGKVMRDGKLESLSLNDGKKVSPNIEPLNEEMAAELNRFKMYDMLKIYSCQVKGDKIILTDIEHKEVLDLHGQVKPISGPLTGPRIAGLQKLPLAALTVWGIRFPEETEVVFNARRTSENLDATILGEDRVLLQVGQPLPSVSNPLPSVRAQRKLFTCPFCRTARTFTEKFKLKQHMSNDH